MPRNLSLATADPAPGRWAVALILTVTLVVFFAGATSEIVKGDEAYHAGFARSWAAAGLAHRPLFNPLYASGDPPGYYYGGEILWSAGLAAAWQLAGVSAYPSWLAQAYQALWYALLLTAVYLAGCQLAGRRYGLAALALAATVPMLTVFSVLLYIDVPAAALAVCALLFLLRRHWFWAGLTMGLVYLTKRNAFFLAGPFALWILVEAARAAAGSPWRRRLAGIAAAALFLAPIVPILVLDDLWRQRHLPTSAAPGLNFSTIESRVNLLCLFNLPIVQQLAIALALLLFLALAFYLFRRARRDGGAARAWAFVLALAFAALLLLKAHTDTLFSTQQLNSHLTRPLCLLTYVGPVLLVLAVVYLVRRSWRGADRTQAWLAISLGLYAFITLLFFTLDTDIRYFLPAAPLAVLLAPRALSRWLDRPRFLAALALAGMACATGAALYVRSERTITPSEREVFRYLRAATPPGALVLYPGEVLMAKANRPVVWTHVLGSPGGLENLPGLLFQDSPAEIIQNLRLNGIAYVCLDRAHTYDDTAIGQLGGYPLSFINKIHQTAGLQKLSGLWGDDVELFRVLPSAP